MLMFETSLFWISAYKNQIAFQIRNYLYFYAAIPKSPASIKTFFYFAIPNAV